MSESLELEAISGATDLETSSEQTDEDAGLVELVRSGDRIAFDRLVVKYQARIFNVCVRMLGNVSDGEDAAQDTFVKVCRNIAQFRGNCRFSTWLYTIAVNTCRNSGRSWWQTMWKKAVKLDKPLVDNEGETYHHELADTRMIPSKDLDQKRRSVCIENAINKLPSIHRELVILRDFQGLSYDEITEITGIAQGTVKSRLARARAALQQELKGVLDEY